MPFSNEGYALIQNLQQYKEYGSRRLLTDFAEIKWTKGAFNSFWKRFRKQKAPTESTGVADQSTSVLKRTWPLTTVDKLVQSQEDQPQTHRSTRQVSRETGLTLSSVVRIICCDLGANFLRVRKVAVCTNWFQLLLVLLTLMFHKVV